jgi:alcohol dehydrogenase class IV
MGESKLMRITVLLLTVLPADTLTNADAAVLTIMAIPTTISSISEIQNPAIAPSIEMKKFFNIAFAFI